MSDKKKLIIPTFAVLALVTGFILYSPSNLLPRTMKTATISNIGLHLAEDAQTIFLISILMNNPSSVPVTITDVDITMLVNGSNYNSMTIGSVDITIPPGQEQSITTMVQLIGSPIGYQPSETQQHYELEITATITGETKSLGMEASRTTTITDTRSWWYSIS